MRITSVKGIALDIAPEDLLFRWDTIDGLNIVTHFAAGYVISILTEYENDAQMLAAALTYAETTGPHWLDSPDCGHRLERFRDKHAPRINTGHVLKEWSKISADLRDHWNHAAHLTAVVETGRLMMEKLHGRAIESEDYLLRAIEILKSKPRGPLAKLDLE